MNENLSQISIIYQTTDQGSSESTKQNEYKKMFTLVYHFQTIQKSKINKNTERT